MDIKERTIGIIGAKRSGKTYFSSRLAEYLGENCIIFNTIGAMNVNNAIQYKIERKDLDKQAIIFGTLIAEKMNRKSTKSISVNLVELTREEIIEFTDKALVIPDKIKDRYIIVDEVSDYLSQIYSQSREMERLIRHGGNFGNTFIFNTQRPAYLNKNTFNLIDVLICFRINWTRDLAVVREMLSQGGIPEAQIKEEIKAITNLPVGYYRPYLLYLTRPKA